MAKKEIKSVVIFTSDGHKYTSPDGKVTYTSTTTPLSILSAAPIEIWKMRVGASKAYIYAKKAANYGTKMHSYAESVCKGKRLYKVPEKYKKDVAAFLAWFKENVEEVLASEIVVHMEKYLLAGTVDFVGRLKGRDGIWIIDWKTGRVKDQHFLQLANYRVLYSEEAGVDKALITNRMVLAIKDGKTREIYPDTDGRLKIDKNDHEDYNIDNDWEVYLNVLAVWRWYKGKNRKPGKRAATKSNKAPKKAKKAVTKKKVK